MDLVYSSIDLLMSTSIMEGTPMVILEAMAYGKPVIATSVGGVPDVIKNNQTGILIKSKDLRSYVAASRQLLSNPSRMKKMGLTGHKHLIKNFTMDLWIEKHLNEYKRFVK